MRLSVKQHLFPGVGIDATRTFLSVRQNSDILGYVSKINTKDAERLEEEGKRLTMQQHAMSKLGIERYYEDLLHGQVGYQEVSDNRGQFLRVLR